MFHLPHSAFFAPVYPAYSQTNHNQQSRRRSVAFDNEFLRHTSADDLIGARSTTRVTDPAEQAHERLLLAIEEQKAARKAYADLVAERELARLEVAVAYPSLAALDFHQLSALETFNIDYSLLLQRQQQRVALQQQQQREQAIIRQRHEEFVHVKRQKVAKEAVLCLKRVREAAHLQQFAALHEQNLEALRQQKLAAHRQQQLDTLRKQQHSLRPQQETEKQRRQQIVEAAHRQQLVEEARRQHHLCRRQEAARRHPAEQHQQGPSTTDEASQAISLAIAIAQQFFSDEPNETSNSVKPTSTPAPTGPAARRVRLAGAPNFVPPAAPIPSSSKPSVTRSAPSSSTAPAIRIAIRDSKGKAAAHVRVNSSPAPAPAPPSSTTTTTSPADAIAALTILASDLDSYLAPEHEWQSEAHRRHALSQLLEQVDAVESSGEEAVRDVRRALVRRVERVLEGVPEEEVVKTKGIVINESKVGVSPVAAAAPAAASPTVAPDAVADVEGYHVPEFLEVTPAVSSGEDSTACPAAPVAAADTDLPETTPWPISQSGWSTIDPTVPAASSQTISFPDEDTFPVPEVTADTPQLSLAAPVLANVSQLDLDNPTLVQYSEDSATKMDDTFIDTFEV